MDNQDHNNNTNNQDADTEAFGKPMLFIAFAMLLVLMTLAFGNWEENQLNPNRSPQSHSERGQVEVLLEQNRYGHYIVDGGINNRSVTFLLDTGATNVAVPGAIEDNLGLVRGSAYYSHTANGRAKAYETTIDRLTIGEIELRNVRASILPGMQGEEVLLGMSVLKNLDLEQKDRTLLLRQHR